MYCGMSVWIGAYLHMRMLRCYMIEIYSRCNHPLTTGERIHQPNFKTYSTLNKHMRFSINGVHPTFMVSLSTRSLVGCLEDPLWLWTAIVHQHRYQLWAGHHHNTVTRIVQTSQTLMAWMSTSAMIVGRPYQTCSGSCQGFSIHQHIPAWCSKRNPNFEGNSYLILCHQCSHGGKVYQLGE